MVIKHQCYWFSFSNTTISDLNKIDFLQPELSVKLRGVDLVSGDVLNQNQNKNLMEMEQKEHYLSQPITKICGLYSALI